MPIFINLKNEDRERLFNLIKINTDDSWENIYPKFNISRAMFYNYINGKYDIPEEIFLEFERMAQIKLKDYNKISKDKYIRKNIKKIRMNCYLSEILGVLNGNGHISRINYEICVVGSIFEKDYYMYLKNLFENNLNLKFNIQQQKNQLKLRAYSINLAKILNKKYGIPIGKKTGKLKIPKQVFDTKILIISYIRGIFDTDGTIYVRRKKDTVLEISSVDKSFLRELKNTLKLLGFNAGISGKNLYLYRIKDINRFFKLIKPANTKHLKKFEIYSTIKHQ